LTQQLTTEERTCTATHLRLSTPPALPTHRVAKTKSNAVNPPRRSNGGDRSGWGRWDTLGGRTLYVFTDATAAFTSALSSLHEGLPTVPIEEVFDDVDLAETGASVSDVVLASLPCPHVQPAVTQGWRLDRTHYEIQLPTEGWFVDIQTAESLAAVNRAFAPHQGIRPLLTSDDLTGGDRELTTDIGSWLRHLTLDDSSQPLGIRYQSSSDSGADSYAVWLHETDDGPANVSSRRPGVVEQYSIPRHDNDLQEVARRHQLKVF
jgi:hypothetical protein